MLFAACVSGQITRLADVHMLSQEAAAKAPQVRARGVIIWMEGDESRNIVVADDSARVLLDSWMDDLTIASDENRFAAKSIKIFSFNRASSIARIWVGATSAFPRFSPMVQAGGSKVG